MRYQWPSCYVGLILGWHIIPIAAANMPHMTINDCWDNAPMESFFGSLKTELDNEVAFETRLEAKGVIFSFIEGFFNRKRLHSPIGYRSPIELQQIAAAA